MKTLISCAYNMDNCCVEVKFSDGSMIAIDTIAVENEIADNTLPAGENPAGVFLFILFPSVGSQFRKEDDNLEALSPLGSCFQMKI